MVTSLFYHLGKPRAQSQRWIEADLAAEARKVILGRGHVVFTGKRNESKRPTASGDWKQAQGERAGRGPRKWVMKGHKGAKTFVTDPGVKGKPEGE